MWQFVQVRGEKLLGFTESSQRKHTITLSLAGRHSISYFYCYLLWNLLKLFLWFSKFCFDDTLSNLFLVGYVNHGIKISAEAKFLTAHIPYKNTQSAQWGDQSGRSESISCKIHHLSCSHWKASSSVNITLVIWFNSCSAYSIWPYDYSSFYSLPESNVNIFGVCNENSVFL